MSFVLRQYQSDALERLRIVFAGKVRRCILVAPTGSGKTILASGIGLGGMTKGARILILAHRTELIRQAFCKFVRAGIPVHDCGVIMGDTKLAAGSLIPEEALPSSDAELWRLHGRRRPRARAQVASIDTLRNRLRNEKPATSAAHAKELEHPDIVIVDECFPAGTIVSGRPIENIRVGDTVDSFNHALGCIEQRRVTDAFSSDSTSLVTVHTTNGRQIVCTSAHPFFVFGRGYLPAKELLNGQVLLVLQSSGTDGKNEGESADRARLLQSRVYGEGATCSLSPADMRDLLWTGVEEEIGWPRAKCAGLLFGRVQADRGRGRTRKVSELALGLQPKACLEANDDGQPDGQSGGTGKDEREPSSYRARAEAEGWQRDPHADASGASCESAGLEDGAHLQNEVPQRGTTVSLQARHCTRGVEDLRGSGRSESCVQTSGGCEARRTFALTRVDRVEVYERPNSGGSRGVRVYNISVDGNENYFAEGVLVHNCHRSLANSYLRLFALYPFAYFIGLTATPYRADGKGLGALYDDMVLVSSPSELIAQGALVEPRVFTVPASDLPDLARIKIKGGDYDQEQLTAAVDQKGLVGNIVEHWKTHAGGRQTVVFAASVKHSKHIVERFVEAGIRAEHLDGETDPDERAAILARLESGETTVVSNYGVLCEGWDQPSVKCCILARPTKSLGLFIQMAGRILRPFRDLTAIILDHAGCVIEHGLPHEDRDMTDILEDAPRRAKKASVSVRECDGCYAVLPSGTRVCEVCGKELPLGGPKDGEMEEAEGTLVEVTKVTREDEIAAYREMLAEAERTGRKAGWAYYRFKEKFQKEPPRGVKPKVVQLDAPEEVMRAEWDRLKAERAERGYKAQWVTVRFEAKFGRSIPGSWLLEDMRAAMAAQGGEMSRTQIGEMVF